VAVAYDQQERRAKAIKKFKARAEAEISKKLSVPRTDRGGEFTSVEFVANYTKEGVVRPHRVVHTAAEWRGGEAQPDCGWHGEVDDEGQEDAHRVLG